MMRMIKTSNRVLCLAVLAVIAIVMYLLNRFTPLFCDDWHYVFIYGTTTPIQTLGDIFRSQWIHYFESTNGRFIAHWFVQLFDGILGKGVFNVFNALAFAVFLYAIALVVARDKNQYYKIISVAFLLVFLLMAGFKYEFLWLSGSFNYLWAGTALLLFHHLLEKEELSRHAHVPLFLFGLVAGWGNEALSVGMSGSYFLYYATHRGQLTPRRLWMLAGFFLGTVLLVLSPASIHRAMNLSAKQIGLVERVVCLQNMRLFFVLLVLMAGKAVVSLRSFKAWVKREQLLLLAVLISLAFILFTGFIYSHSRFGIELFSLLLILRMIGWERVGNAPVTVANAVVLAFAAHVVMVAAGCHDVACRELLMAADRQALIPTVSPVKDTSPLRRYILDYQGLGMREGIDEVKYYGEDDWIPKYYGHNDEFVYFFPKVFLDDLKAHSDLYNRFRTLDGVPFYAMRLLPGQHPDYALLHYGPSRFASWPWPLNRVCAKLADEVVTDVSPVKVMPIDGENYAVVHKLRPGQDNRLKDIVLKTAQPDEP